MLTMLLCNFTLTKKYNWLSFWCDNKINWLTTITSASGGKFCISWFCNDTAAWALRHSGIRSIESNLLSVVVVEALKRSSSSFLLFLRRF